MIGGLSVFSCLRKSLLNAIHGVNGGGKVDHMGGSIVGLRLS